MVRRSALGFARDLGTVALLLSVCHVFVLAAVPGRDLLLARGCGCWQAGSTRRIIGTLDGCRGISSRSGSSSSSSSRTFATCAVWSTWGTGGASTRAACGTWARAPGWHWRAFPWPTLTGPRTPTSTSAQDAQCSSRLDGSYGSTSPRSAQPIVAPTTFSVWCGSGSVPPRRALRPRLRPQRQFPPSSGNARALAATPVPRRRFRRPTPARWGRLGRNEEPPAAAPPAAPGGPAAAGAAAGARKEGRIASAHRLGENVYVLVSWAGHVQLCTAFLLAWVLQVQQQCMATRFAWCSAAVYGDSFRMGMAGASDTDREGGLLKDLMKAREARAALRKK